MVTPDSLSGFVAIAKCRRFVFLGAGHFRSGVLLLLVIVVVVLVLAVLVVAVSESCSPPCPWALRCFKLVAPVEAGAKTATAKTTRLNPRRSREAGKKPSVALVILKRPTDFSRRQSQESSRIGVVQEKGKVG